MPFTFHTWSLVANGFNCWLILSYFHFYYLLCGQLSVVLLAFVCFVFLSWNISGFSQCTVLLIINPVLSVQF